MEFDNIRSAWRLERRIHGWGRAKRSCSSAATSTSSPSSPAPAHPQRDDDDPSRSLSLSKRQALGSRDLPGDPAPRRATRRHPRIGEQARRTKGQSFRQAQGPRKVPPSTCRIRDAEPVEVATGPRFTVRTTTPSRSLSLSKRQALGSRDLPGDPSAPTRHPATPSGSSRTDDDPTSVVGSVETTGPQFTGPSGNPAPDTPPNDTLGSTSRPGEQRASPFDKLKDRERLLRRRVESLILSLPKQRLALGSRDPLGPSRSLSLSKRQALGSRGPLGEPSASARSRGFGGRSGRGLRGGWRARCRVRRRRP